MDVYTTLNVISENGKQIGHLQFDDQSFEIYDLTGGVVVFCESNLAAFTKPECGVEASNDVPQQRGTAGDPCENIKTKILVLYDPAAAAKEADITGKANLAVSQINQIWANSQVNNDVSIVAIKPLAFTESGFIDNDVVSLSNNTTAQSLRNQYKAEIVVLLVDGSNYSTYGIAKKVGASFGDAYVIVNTSTATYGRYTFAHEVNHLYDAHHDDDNSGGNARGHTFRTGSFAPIFGTKRYTLMAVLGNGGRIEYLSNPAVKLSGQPTGTSDRDNAVACRV